MVSCAYPERMRVKEVPPRPKAQQESLQENAQKLRLQKDLSIWEKTLNEIIYELQIEIEKNKVSLYGEPSTEDNTFLTKKNQIVTAYLEDLKRIRILQHKLTMGDTALSREIFYLDLVDHYLATLKCAESLRGREYQNAIITQKLEDGIAANYQKNNYYKVVELYNQLAKINSGEKINFTSRAYYALSLVCLNQGEDARNVIEELMSKDFSLTSDNAPLYFTLGECLINNGQTQRAQEIFQKLNAFYMNEESWYAKVKGKASLLQTGPQEIMIKNKLDQAHGLLYERGDFLKAYHLGIEAQRECLDLTCQSGVQDFLNQLTEQGIDYIDGKLRELDSDIKMSKYSEAQAVLFSLKRSFPPGEYPFSLQEKIALIPKTETLLNKNKPINVSDETEKQKLERGNHLLESENFEEAIALYEELAGTAYKLDAEEKKLLAIDGLARTRRLKASQLFLQARSSKNVEHKKSYLIESYNLLKSVLDKYPNNTYADRIIKNLTDVRAEIEKVYPEFFSEEGS
jgi:tetratricopeptide (TPR) repeat protein